MNVLQLVLKLTWMMITRKISHDSPVVREMSNFGEYKIVKWVNIRQGALAGGNDKYGHQRWRTNIVCSAKMEIIALD